MRSLAAPIQLTRVHSVRMGLGFFIVGFANLTGTPIVGALLKHDYPWWKAIVFSGVSILSSSLRCTHTDSRNKFQTTITFGAILIIIARQMMVKRKGTNVV